MNASLLLSRAAARPPPEPQSAPTELVQGAEHLNIKQGDIGSVGGGGSAGKAEEAAGGMQGGRASLCRPPGPSFEIVEDKSAADIHWLAEHVQVRTIPSSLCLPSTNYSTGLGVAIIATAAECCSYYNAYCRFPARHCLGKSVSKRGMCHQQEPACPVCRQAPAGGSLAVGDVYPSGPRIVCRRVLS